LPVAICAQVVRPGLAWLVAATSRGGALVRCMAQARDVEGFARLRQACDHDAQTPAATGHTLHRAAVVLAAKGGTVADITVGDVLELLDVEASVHRQPMAHGAAFYRALHRMGVLAPSAPARMRALRGSGQRTPEQLIDRFALACRPVRDLLVDYLRERQPALDYSSLRTLAADLGNVFGRTWKATIPVSIACTCRRRSLQRGSSGCAPDLKRSSPARARGRSSPSSASATASA
jgi:hypothetical protein